MTTKETIREWIAKGIEEKYEFIIVACDTFSWENYPIFCKDDLSCIKEFVAHDQSNMQKVMEVYNLKQNIEKQLNNKINMALPDLKYKVKKLIEFENGVSITI